MGLRDKLKFDLSKTEDRLKLVILVGGSLLLILLAVVGGISQTMSPEFCKLCHKTMTPEYVTWQNSSHSQIACVDCHMEPGLINLVKEKIKATGHLKEYITGSYEENWPIKMKHELPSHLCEQCHSVSNRNFTLSGDLKIPHERHGEKGVDCVQCHSGVAHGNIAGREVTKGADVSVWTKDDGKKNMAAEFVRPDMDTCVACHMDPASFGIKDVKRVTWSCEACHKNIYTPQSHNASNWLGVHGIDAENSLSGCIGCHAIGGDKGYEATGIIKINNPNPQVQDYVWKTEFCIKCHSQKPKDHQDKSQWMPAHKDAVANKQLKNCVACHSIQQAKSGETLKSPAKVVSCNNCHWFK